jgi:hypothetical protein
MLLRKSSLRVSAFGALLLASCSSNDREPRATTVATPSWPDAIPASVAHRDPRLGVPSFVWITRSGLPKAASAREAATATLRGLAKTYELEPAALATATAPEIHDAGEGPILARFKQRVGGVEVFRGGLSLLMSRDLEPIAASGLFARAIDGASDPFVIDDLAALSAASALVPERHPSSFAHLDDAAGYARFTAPGLHQPARVKKVLYPTRTSLVPAYYVEIMLSRGGAWSFVVAAADGRELFRNDLVKHDAFTYRVWADPDTRLPMDGPQGNGAAPHPTGKPDGFRPAFVPSSLVTLESFPFSKNDPWLPAGATQTLGNNVRAYADLAAPDGLDQGGLDTPANATSAATFDWTFDLAQSPGATPSNVNASVTQLFYVTNFLHDWYYDVGFDEKSGNHQASNFGRGGVERDPLLAEAQDYDGRNNADAATPGDGASPRIQMYVWSGQSQASLVVSAPPQIAGTKPVGLASFGRDAFDLTGDVVVADDGQGADARDACEPIANAVAGKIVLVHRGLCSFVQKAQNVQAAGGVGVLVANVASSAQPTTPPFMGGTASNVSIPILSLAVADGQAIESAVGAGAVTVQMIRKLQTDVDGSLDTSVVAHEWGHVLSNRLVGDGNGLTTNQAGGLGEGWGDFSALMVIARADDPGNFGGAYTNGGYATSGSSDFYFGTRRVPYSVDFSKNPLTFKHIANGTPLPTTAPINFGEDGSFNAEVHSTGEVWATMLWESYVALLRSGRYSFAEAQQRMKRYLVASLKVTPVDPTLLEARDAVLAAALATDERDYRTFWEAFARRGAGVGAEGPPKDSTNNQGVKESSFVGNSVQLVSATLSDDTITCDHDGILDPGEVGSVEVTVRNDGVETLTQATAEIAAESKVVTLAAVTPQKLPTLKPFETTKIKLPISIAKGTPVDPIEIAVVVKDPAFGENRIQKIVVPARYGADEAPESSAKDDVETKHTAWSAKGADALGDPWTRKRTTDGTWWTVADPNVPSDQRLTSPKFAIEGTTFSLSFKHRWSFRFSTRRNVDVDGGVVELSTDGGKTWKDAAEVGGRVDYNTTLDAARGDNPLKGRKAYGNKSQGYPDKWITSKIDFALKSHPDTLQVRFRAGSSTGFSGAPGWEIDDIALDGIASKPFYSFVPHADTCDPNGPSVDAGAPSTVKARALVKLTATGSHPTNLPLTYVWTQESGPDVTTKGEGPSVVFTAPDTPSSVTLGFAVRAHDGKLLSPASRVEVTVVPDDGSPTSLEAGGGGCACRTAASPKRGAPGAIGLAFAFAFAIGLVARRRRIRG